MSTSTLIKHFKKVTGTTIYQYQLNTKLEMARLLLANEQQISLKEIAASYGFCDEFHFSKLFKKEIWAFSNAVPEGGAAGSRRGVPGAVFLCLQLTLPGA